MYSGPEASPSASGMSKASKRSESEAECSTMELDIKPKYFIPLKPDAKIVVAIDFGTTYSGFAYALSSDIEKVYLYYDWPGQHVAEAKPYCKTQTSLRYMPVSSDSSILELRDWGWKALWNHKQALQNSRMSSSRLSNSYDQEFRSCGYLATKFKLKLAPSLRCWTEMLVSPFLQGLTPKRLISDYLRCLSEFIMKTLQNSYGDFISKKNVQWCLTVPSLWDDAAKHEMVECAEIAGLVRGPLCHDRFVGPYSLIIVLEPEAASVYCQRKLKEVNFTKGSKFLVVDVGGGTVDLVVHEKVDDSGLKVKEIACSSGDMCGGTYVDEAFYRFLAEKIVCFEDFSTQYPATVLKMQEYIEKIKCSFDGECDSFLDYIEIPARLAKVWENYDINSGWWRGNGMYDTLSISKDDLIAIFSEVVDKILQLIGNQLDANPKLEVILVVGGFSSSPYLMRRIREQFSSVCRILNPVDPGSAVCHGAVAFGAPDAEVMLSRKSRKTYGIASYRAYRMDDPSEKIIITDDGRTWCRDAFDIFVKKGDDIPVDHSVKHEFSPFEKRDTNIVFDMYATTDTTPSYVTDLGMELVGSWTYPIPPGARRLQELPSIEVEMFFGRAMIEVAAKPRNFQGTNTMMSVKFERNFF